MEHLVRENPQRRRYELVVDGEIVSIADYEVRDEVLVVPHVETSPVHRGQGMADRLMEGMLDDLRATNRRVTPVCPFAAAYMRERPDTHDLLA